MVLKYQAGSVNFHTPLTLPSHTSQLQVPAWERTPAWGGPAALKDQAGPKSWKGVGAALEDWGELNTGKRPPAVFVLDTERGEVQQVRGQRGGRGEEVTVMW